MKPSSSRSEPAADFAEERRLIHELANHLTIAQGAVRRVVKLLESGAKLPAEERTRLVKADDYLKQSAEALRELRASLLSRLPEPPP